MNGIPYTPAPAPPQPLLLSDVWKPLTARDVIQFDLFQSQADEAKLRRRIEYNKLQGDEAFAKAAPELYNVLFGQGKGQGGQQNALAGAIGDVGTIGTPTQPQGGNQLQAPQGVPTQPPQGQGQPQGQTAPAGQPTREQQWKAILDSIPNAQGKIQAMQFIQKTLTDNANNWMELAKPVFLQALEQGDNTLIQTLRENAKKENNPILNQRLASIGHVEITGKKKMQTTGNFSKEAIQKYIDELPPGSAKPEAKAGIWKVVREGGKTIEITEEKPKGITSIGKYEDEIQQLLAQGKPEDSPEIKVRRDAIAKLAERPETGTAKTMEVSDKWLKALSQKNFNYPLSPEQVKQLDPGLVREAETYNVIQRVEDPNTNKVSYVPKGEAPTLAAGFRYPTYMPAPGMVGVSYSRRTGKYSDSATGQQLTREQAIGRFGEGAILSADKAALTQLTEREQLISIFVNRIDANVPIVLDAIKDIKNTDSRLLNQGINQLQQYFIGSGKWQAVQTATRSLSNEVQRVESNALGIGGQGEEERRVWAKIHDPNMSLKDWGILANMILKLSHTAKKAVGDQRKELSNRFKRDVGLEEETPGKGITEEKPLPTF